MTDAYIYAKPKSNSTTNTSYFSCGIVAGIGANSTVTNCHTSGYVCNNGSSYGSGGIMGYNYYSSTAGTTSSTISRCSSTANVANSNSSCAGGIMGKSLNNGTFTECWFKGNVYASSGQAGGIPGDGANASSGNISNCWASGMVCANGAANTSALGGLCGGRYATISNSFFTGNLYNKKYGCKLRPARSLCNRKRRQPHKHVLRRCNTLHGYGI